MNPDYFTVGAFGRGVVFVLFIGLRGFVTQKPFLISQRWFFVLVPFLLLIPSLDAALGLGAAAGVDDLGYTVFICVCVVIMAFRVRGYAAYGVTDASLREGVLASLQKLDLPYEDTPTGLRLPTIGADLQVKGPWSSLVGGSVKMNHRQFSRVLSDIVREMNEYYQSGTIAKVNLTHFTVNVLIGVLLAVPAGVFFWLKFGKP